MTEKYSKKPTVVPAYIDRKSPAVKAQAKFKEFIRASDKVEWVDPTGALETIDPHDAPGSAYKRTDRFGGAPTIHITPYGCQLVEFYAAQGLPHALIASRLGIDRQTFEHRMMDQANVAEALSRGMADNEYELGECLMGMARRGNVIAAIYLTKTRHKWRDNDPIQQNTQNNVVIQLPGSMSLDDLKQLAASGISPMQLAQATETPAPEALPVIETVSE